MRRFWWLLPLLLVALVVTVWRLGPQLERRLQPSRTSVDGPARTFPELDGVTVPPNIAAPGLRIDEPGTAWYAELKGSAGPVLRVGSRTPGIRFSLRAWRKLLAANQGGRLRLTVSVRGADGAWTDHAPAAFDVAAEPVDRYLVYRWLTPLYSWWRDVGIYQRDLTSYQVRTVLHGRQLDQGCVNCHTFRAGHSDHFALGFRGQAYGAGTALATDRRAQRWDQKIGYSSWHPNGNLLAFSDNAVRQSFHEAGEETREVLDLSSDLYYLSLTTQQVMAVPGLAEPDGLETYPCWSPDGRWLYCSRARTPWTSTARVPPPGYQQVHYSLLRIGYDPETDAWGEPEVLVDGETRGRSYVFPRASPDGRYLLYTHTTYGCFPIHQPGSDLGLLDLATGQEVPLSINSDRQDTWHSWSTNGRWFIFSSKRADGLFTKEYLSYFDADGHAHRPLLLPQRDPEFYDRFWYSYNTPELVAEPLQVNAGQLGRAVRHRPGLGARLPSSGAGRSYQDQTAR